MRLEHHLVGGYVRYISPHIIIIISGWTSLPLPKKKKKTSLYPPLLKNNKISMSMAV